MQLKKTLAAIYFLPCAIVVSIIISAILFITTASFRLKWKDFKDFISTKNNHKSDYIIGGLAWVIILSLLIYLF